MPTGFSVCAVRSLQELCLVWRMVAGRYNFARFHSAHVQAALQCRGLPKAAEVLQLHGVAAPPGCRFAFWWLFCFEVVVGSTARLAQCHCRDW